VALTGLALLIMLLSIGLNDSKEIAAANRPGGGSPVGRLGALRSVWPIRSYVLLVIGYFVCGFHVAFVGATCRPTSPTRESACRCSALHCSPAELGGWSIGMVGLFNQSPVPSCGAQWAPGTSARTSCRCSTCCARWCFLGLRPGAAVGGLGADLRRALGFLWLGTVPADHVAGRYIFGPVHLTMLNGVVLLRPSGRQLLRRLGRRTAVRPAQGNYDMMWWISIALGLVAAALHWPIVEERLTRPTAALPQPHELSWRSFLLVERRFAGGPATVVVVRPVGLNGQPSDRSDRRLLPLISPPPQRSC